MGKLIDLQPHTRLPGRVHLPGGGVVVAPLGQGSDPGLRIDAEQRGHKRVFDAFARDVGVHVRTGPTGQDKAFDESPSGACSVYPQHRLLDDVPGDGILAEQGVEHFALGRDRDVALQPVFYARTLLVEDRDPGQHIVVAGPGQTNPFDIPQRHGRKARLIDCGDGDESLVRGAAQNRHPAPIRRQGRGNDRWNATERGGRRRLGERGGGHGR